MMTLTSTQIGQLVAQFFLAGAGTLSFAVLFACPKRTLPCCALVGAVGWFVYELAVLYGADAAAASSSRSSRCRWRHVSAPSCSKRR
ncbi:MAG: threonine/serine exporter family protein [Faecalibacterium prausnitzii]